MFVFLSYDKTPQNDYWAGQYHCPVCGEKSHFHLQKNTRDLCVLFFSVMTMTDDRFLRCDSCNYTKKLRIRGYSKIKKHQLSLLDSGRYPKEMIQADFTPKNVPLGWKLFKLILTAAWSFLMIVTGVILSFQDGTANPLIGCLFLWMFNSVPFCFSLHSFLPDVKKRSIYKKSTGFPSVNEIPASLQCVAIDNAQVFEKRDIDEHIFDRMDGKVPTKDNPEPQTQVKENFTKDVKKPYKTGRGWLTFGAILFTVPWSFLSKNNFHAICSRLAANRFKVFNMLSLVFWVLTLFLVGCGISFVVQGEESAPKMFFLALFTAALWFIFTLINRKQMNGIIKSLYTLAAMGGFCYINEVMPYIGTAKEKVVFTEHLLYDKGSRLVADYNSIIWAYSVMDNDGKITAALGLIDGKIYGAEMGAELLNAFLKRKPNVMVGLNKENEAIYKQRVAEFKARK